MRIAYVHGFAGVSGPMLLGALVDAGAALAAVQEVWQRLELPIASVRLESVRCADYTAKHPVVTLDHTGAFLSSDTYASWCASLEQRLSSTRAAQRLRQILTHFADAVTQLQGASDPDHFLGSAYTPTVLTMGSGIVAALESLDVDQLDAAPVNLGTGLHPLTAALVRGASVYGARTAGELTTVDGAAILVGLASHFGPLPLMTMTGTGYGSDAQTPEQPGRGLQVVLGETAADSTAERIAVLETNVDDMNPEFYETIFERLLSNGALDVTLTPLLMKKGRPANTLTVLAPLSHIASLCRLMLVETSTFGVRVYEVWRQKLERFSRPVETCYGEIPVKCGVLDGRLVQAAPEYEACKRAALAHKVAVRLVYAEASRLAAIWLRG